MPRINLDDSLYKEGPFIELVLKTGSLEVALGALVRAWTVAQKYWVPERKRIPREVWEREKLRREIVDCGMAEESSDGVYMRGSEDQFAWLFQRSEAGKVPKKRRRKSKADPAQQSLIDYESVDDRSISIDDGSSSVGDRVETSPSPSFSEYSSHSDSVYNYSKGALAAAPIDSNQRSDIKNPIGFFVANYVTAYKGKYGDKARPALTGKVQGQIKRFLSDVSLDRACNLIQQYLVMNDPWFVNKGHDFSTFLENLNKVGLALDTGKTVTLQQANEQARRENNSDVIANYRNRTAGGVNGSR